MCGDGSSTCRVQRTRRASLSRPCQRPGLSLPKASGVQVAADQRVIDEKSEADAERNDSKSRGDPGIRFDSTDERECNHVSESAGDQQDAGSTRAGRFRKLGLHGYVHSAGESCHALVGAQLAHMIKGVHRCQGNPKDHNHRYQTDQISVHGVLLLRPLAAVTTKYAGCPEKVPCQLIMPYEATSMDDGRPRPSERDDAHRTEKILRNSRRRIFPEGVLGSASTK